MAADDVLESMSMPHSRNPWYRLAPRPGDVLVTNLRRPILRLLEDSSPGVHDTLIPSCDSERYRQLGAPPDHGSCPDTSMLAAAIARPSLSFRPRESLDNSFQSRHNIVAAPVRSLRPRDVGVRNGLVGPCRLPHSCLMQLTSRLHAARHRLRRYRRIYRPGTNPQRVCGSASFITPLQYCDQRLKSPATIGCGSNSLGRCGLSPG